MADETLSHRVGEVKEITSTSEHSNPAGRTYTYSRSRILWDDGEETFRDLLESYQPGDRVALVYRGDMPICDINLRTGRQSVIGDRVEGIAAVVMLAAWPLSFILIGLPFYWGVKLHAKISTERLRRRIATYVAREITPLVKAA